MKKILYFSAAWCGPCRTLGPIMQEATTEGVVYEKIDVDTNQDLSMKYGVRNIPTVLLFDKGELVGRQVGVAPKKAYSDAIDAVL